jgi:hypothetical protein
LRDGNIKFTRNHGRTLALFFVKAESFKSGSVAKFSEDRFLSGGELHICMPFVYGEESVADCDIDASESFDLFLSGLA